MFRPAKLGEKTNKRITCMVYEDNPNASEIDIEALNQKDREDYIRKGKDEFIKQLSEENRLDVLNRKIAVNLLKKYKPLINLNKERALFLTI